MENTQDCLSFSAEEGTQNPAWWVRTSALSLLWQGYETTHLKPYLHLYGSCSKTPQWFHRSVTWTPFKTFYYEFEISNIIEA